MKKLVCIAVIIACLVGSACGGVWLADRVREDRRDCYSNGFDVGILYAIENMQLSVTDRYNPDDPDASAWYGYDLRIFIDLDGEVFEHGVYVG